MNTIKLLLGDTKDELGEYLFNCDDFCYSEACKNFYKIRKCDKNVSDIKNVSEIKNVSDIKNVSEIKNVSDIKNVSEIKNVSDNLYTVKRGTFFPITSRRLLLCFKKEDLCEKVLSQIEDNWNCTEIINNYYDFDHINKYLILKPEEDVSSEEENTFSLFEEQINKRLNKIEMKINILLKNK